MTVRWDQEPIDARVRQAAFRAVVRTTELVLEDGTRLIASPPKTGRVYERHNPRRTHQASAPGEAPATDLGALMASGRTIYPDQQDLFIVRGTVNWSTAYARALELGTEKIAPRPYARPAIDHAAPSLQTGMQAELNREFKK